MSNDAEWTAINQVAQQLSTSFPAVEPAVVTRVVRETYRRFDQHPRRDFVPILVADSARDALRVMSTDETRRRP